MTKNTFDDLFDYLIEGEAENFALQLQQLLKAIVSVYDTANKESLVLCQVWVQVKLRFLSISYPAIKAAFFL